MYKINTKNIYKKEQHNDLLPLVAVFMHVVCEIISQTEHFKKDREREPRHDRKREPTVM